MTHVHLRVAIIIEIVLGISSIANETTWSETKSPNRSLLSKYGPSVLNDQSEIKSFVFEGAHLTALVPVESVTHHKNRTKPRRRLDEINVSESGMSPLFLGIGTHYAHVYVGNPPQRVSVIVDTGSHHTAFPCSGCKSCGHHTDPYFDPSKSQTLEWLQCHQCVSAARCVQRKCQISQSYTEGSSWKAYQMRDAFYVGGETLTSRPRSALEEREVDGSGWLWTNFIFGCQTYETGLFRTQKADGIMGMSMHSQTLVPTMKSSGKIDHSGFSLCFMYGGGTMVLGGVDRRLHKSLMEFTPLAKKSGWFTVRLIDIRLNEHSLKLPSSVFATGKGTIIDSGTTDTYLPRRATERFKHVWSEIMGSSPKYANTKLSYSPEHVANFPTITFVFENEVEVAVKPSAYIEQAGGKYIPRVYLTEASGTVLGANFMQDHDIYFDTENRRVGFAEAECEYMQHRSG